MSTGERVHGGPDAAGAARWDFSTNANACGPCPQAWRAVQEADASRYPDPSYTALRAALARHHGVESARIVLAGSASEFIFRTTAWVARQHGSGATVCLSTHHYGDYAAAARAWGLRTQAQPQGAALLWACEPSSPLGQPHPDLAQWMQGLRAQQTLVLDCAYAPLRLQGRPSLDAAQLQRVWQLFSPNKALGLTGVRAAYAIAPLDTPAAQLLALQALAPSWVLGAHGLALLNAWCQPSVQQWLQDCLPLLRSWKAAQSALLQRHGWEVASSEANYFCARPPSQGAGGALCLHTLRQHHGVQLRDASSFGLLGWVRLGVREPAAQNTLQTALCEGPRPLPDTGLGVSITA